MNTLPTRRLRTRKGRELSLTELSFGTAPLGNLYRPIAESEAQATLAAAWNGGCRSFDTAPLYGLGLAEARLNHFLREKQRSGYVLSTKVGRRLKWTTSDRVAVRSHYFATPSRAILFDYSFDGVFRSVEDSLERLGLDQIDVLYAHDLGADTHGSRAASDQRLREFLDGGYRALEQLRAQGVVHAIGAGCNEWEVCEALIKSADIDLILLAGRYTLLEQTALDTFLPLCAEKGVGVVVGGPYNSGILAGGAMYNYQPAPADIVARVRDLKAVCEAHGVGLAEAALRFPLGHPAVVSVVAGAISPAEVEGNIAAIGRSIPPVLWSDLKAERLIRGDAPVPM